MRGPSWWKKACAVLMLCAATAIVSPAQTFTTIVNFNGGDGSNPLHAPLVQGVDGSLYGTTAFGGDTSGCGGCGTLFEITPAGRLITLHEFNGSDGNSPMGGLVQAADANFYGTSVYGGVENSGTVFKMTPVGTTTTLYSFCQRPNCVDGLEPVGGLIQAANDNFYGTTQIGGINNYGTVFRMTPAGTLTTLHSFNQSDGALPSSTLLQATDGSLYGSTYEGGASNVGTIFKIDAAGVLTTLYTFCTNGDCLDGSYPYGGVIQGLDGNLYGTTGAGGAYNEGTVFELSLTGGLTTLHDFSFTDGLFPKSGLTQASDGNFYGTAPSGGKYYVRP
ncbi:MAG: choice-of-anchor tandem repeat GloVer-containing protein [Terriglobales bacterium]